MNKSVGIIDSGIGGTSLLKYLQSYNLAADFYYQSDSKNVPYGNKSQDFMLKRMRQMLIPFKGFDAVVVACNTLTAETIEVLRSEFDVRLFGIEPYINYLHHKESLNQKLALILTEATYHSERFQNLRKKVDPDHLIDIYPLKRLALLIENYKQLDLSEVESELRPLKNKGYDKLILGCTHYPLLKDKIENFLQLSTIDPNNAVARHIVESLQLNAGESKSFYRFELEGQWERDIDLPLVRPL